MIGRNFHDEGGNVTGQHDALDEKPRDDGRHNTDEVDAEHQVLAVGREECDGKEHVHGHAGAATHERSHHDRDDAVRGAVHRAGGHDGGHVAAKAHDERHEGLARQTHAAHDAVHHKGGAGHVARVFEHGQKEEEEEDRGHERGHGRDAAADAVGQNDLKPLGQTDEFEQSPEAVHEDPREGDVEEVDEGRAQVLREEEHHVHDRQEDRRPEPAIQDHAVNLVGHRHAGFAAAHQRLFRDAAHKAVTRVGHGNVGVAVKFGAHRLQALAHLLEGALRELVLNARGPFDELQGKPFGALDAFVAERVGDFRARLFDALIKGDVHRRHRRVLQKGRQSLFEVLDALFTGGHQTHDRAAKFLGKGLKVDVDLAVLGDVEHVDRHEHGHAHFDELRGQIQVALKVGGVDDVDDGLRFVREDVVARDALVFARVGRRRNRINTRQVDDFDLFALALKGADELVDRHARPVAHLLMSPREGVEKRRLAAVGIADDADDVFRHFEFLPYCALTCMMAASSLRTLMKLPRTRISTGSPRGATRTTSKLVPGVAPSMSRRRRYSGALLS